MLHIRLFGGLSVAWNEIPLPAIVGLPARSLFAYLVTYRNRAHTRDLLAGTFWPDLPDVTARRRLSQALWQISRVPTPLPGPAPYLLTDADTVQFNVKAPYWLDIEVFEKALRELRGTPPSVPPSSLGSLRNAVELYRGDFLAGYYDDWAVIERERLRELLLAALTELIVQCKEQGNYEEALRHAQRLTAEDPLREEGHREVMRLYYLLGRTNEALQQYEVCRTVLAEELDAEPTPATTALYREIAARAGEATVPYLPPAYRPPVSSLLEGAGSVPLVGREEERAMLVGRLDQAMAGRGGLVLVEGEPGVGKTRLLQAVAEDAEWREVPVLWGRGRELTELPPYGVLREALEAGLSPLRAGQLGQLVEGVWLREVSQLVPQLAEWLPDLPPRVPLAPEEEQRRLREALTQTVRALGQLAPHLVILDDLQWPDESTLAALISLAPHLTDSRVLVIVGYRGEEARAREVVWEALRTLDRTVSPERLVVGRLAAKETGELIRQGLGLAETDRRFEERLYRETRGNPLFVLETLRALHEEGRLYWDEGSGWRTAWDEMATDEVVLPLSPKLHRVIAGRLAWLEPEVRLVLNAAAVLGTDFDLSLLARASQAVGAVVLKAVDELARRGLLVAEQTTYRFSHDKVRQVAYEVLTEEERQRLHRRAGEAMEARNPERSEALAYHYEQGQVWEKAVHCHRLAGKKAAEVHAYETAVSHFSAALALADQASLAPQQRWDLLAARQRALSLLGEHEAQAADLAAMTRLAQGDAARLADVLRRRAWFLIDAGHFDEAEAATREALALAQQLSDKAGQVAALTALGTAMDRRGDYDRATQPLRAAVEICQRWSDNRREAEAHEALASAIRNQGNLIASRYEAEAALTLYEALNDMQGQARTLNTIGMALREQGVVDDALACHRRAMEICRTIGYRFGEAYNMYNLGLGLYAHGRFTKALHDWHEAIAICRAIGANHLEALIHLNVGIARNLILGDYDTATEEIRATLAYAREIGHRGLQGWCLDQLGSMALRQGERQTARTHLAACLSLIQASGERYSEMNIRYRDLVPLALVEGQVNEAMEHVEAAESICQELGVTEGREFVNILRSRADVLLAQGKLEAALATSAEAMAFSTSGVGRGVYLVPFTHYRVLQALNRTKEARAAIVQAYQALMASLDGFTPEQQRMSLERVPEHRAIVAAWEAVQLQPVTFRLPRADAPTGRPLREDEWVEVLWTVEAPEDEEIAGKAARRQHQLLGLVQEAEDQGASPTVDGLAEALDVSRATIKRDLAALRRAGHQVRTRGSRKH